MQKTIQNLAAAFVGESQARNRYTMYSKIAKKEGFEQIAEIFLQTADNEREHAAKLFNLINELNQKLGKKGESLKLETEVPTVYGTTAENLAAAIAGENHEYTQMYPDFANVADQENLPEIAARLRAIAKAEEHHEQRYKQLLEVVESNTVFKKETPIEWVCRECGYKHFGMTPPQSCPACDHAQSFYQVKCEQF